MYRSLIRLVQKLLSEFGSIRATVGSHQTVSETTADLESNASTVAANDADERYLHGKFYEYNITISPLYGSLMTVPEG